MVTNGVYRTGTVEVTGLRLGIDLNYSLGLSRIALTNAVTLRSVNGDFRLRPDSPCIDAGTDRTELLATDILGLPRPLDGDGDGVGRNDMGAYEFNPYRFGPVLRPDSTGFSFTVRGEPGKSVRIERSRDLVTWEHVATVPILATGQTLIDPAAAAEAFLFYRAAAVP